MPRGGVAQSRSSVLWPVEPPRELFKDEVRALG
jgi:GMP synthase PP-ATPase subunit